MLGWGGGLGWGAYAGVLGCLCWGAGMGCLCWGAYAGVLGCQLVSKRVRHQMEMWAGEEGWDLMMWLHSWSKIYLIFIPDSLCMSLHCCFTIYLTVRFCVFTLPSRSCRGCIRLTVPCQTGDQTIDSVRHIYIPILSSNRCSPALLSHQPCVVAPIPSSCCPIQPL